MPIIYFFGADGAGKTTLAKILAKRLKENGLRVRISWMRGSHTLASLVARLLSRFNVFRGCDNPYYKMNIPRSLRGFWQFLEFISLLPILLSYFLIPSWIGYIVIAERYIPDFIVWISLTTNDPNYPESLYAKFLLKMALKARIRIYVTARYSELIKRKKDLNPSFIWRQIKLYEKLAKALNSFRLDTTNKSISESEEALFNTIDFKQDIKTYSTSVVISCPLNV